MARTSKRRASTDQTERYVRWTNLTSLAIAKVGDIALADNWTPGITMSLPESASADAVALGLTRIGYAAT